ncbi:MAG: hypothetical protein ACRDZN_10080 [Acidimicrobiales bacterium]
MRIAIRIWALVLAAFVATTCWPPGPASAKGGAISVTISGPGLRSPLEVSGKSHPDQFGQIETGLWDAMPDSTTVALAPKAGTKYLGPRHTLVWQIMAGPGELTPIHQDLYLYADGGALTYTAPGQPIRDSVTRGGWYRAPAGLRQALADACVPIIGDFGASTVCAKEQMVAKAASAPGSRPAAEVGPPAASSGASPWPEAIAGMTGATALAIGGTVAVRRSRQRRRMAPVSP